MATRRHAVTEAETPSETPEPVDEPVQETPVEAPAAYAEPQPEAIFVEPLLGLAEFVSVAGLSAPAQAALRRWLQTQRLDRQRHLTLAQWQAYHAQMLAYTG
jgi:hypothetical protein